MNKMVRKKKKARKKKVVKKKVRPEDTVHIKLNSPIESRRAILAEAVNVVDLLKRHEKIKVLRKEKTKALNDFRTALHELNKVLRLVRLSEMPLKMDELKKVRDVEKHPVFEEVKPVVTKKKVVKKVVKTYTDPLDAQMAELKRKLAKL